MTHKKSLGKASRKLDGFKKTDPAKYRRKEKALNRALRRLRLI